MKQQVQRSGFLEQIEQSRKAVQKWPHWMQESASIASASFPKSGSLQLKDDSRKSKDSKQNHRP
ncbi:hypothetical protein [Piscinibacter sakaiensis]|uniref:hypothetical protein n=1 Tax=Piscinibacter sakaiensis TaxID=1547922 RepID=UPI003AAA37A5